MIPQISDWTATRSGACITITGTLDGAPFKLTSVTKITVRNGAVIATSAVGEYALAV